MGAERNTRGDLLPVLVCGGGPVGGVLALALAGAGLQVGLVEAGGAPATSPAHSPGAGPDDDGELRPIALSASSVRILGTLGVWPAIAPHAAPILTVHVSEQGRFGMVRLRAEEQGVEALGHVTGAAAIARALEPALAAAGGVTRIRPATARGVIVGDEAARVVLDPPRDPAPAARLVAAADGGASGLRESSGIGADRYAYRQAAVTCAVTPGAPHGNVAYERFTDTGPLALLPLADGRCGLVWTLPEERAGAVAALGDGAFLALLQRAFGGRLGRLEAAGTRRVFPLELVRSRVLTAPRVALVGNAANQLHPVAGQGLNLGLRDAATLAELAADAVRSGRDPGGEAVLAEYARRRRPDQRAVVRFTDALARGFTAGPSLLGTLRSAGMLALDLVPPASRALARRAMGLAGRQPRLVRGLTP